MSTKRKTGVQRQIEKLQATTNFLIPRSCIERVIKETIQDRTYSCTCRVTNDAVEMLHSASEDHLIKMFQAANVIATKADRLTVTDSDMKTATEVSHILT